MVSKAEPMKTRMFKLRRARRGAGRGKRSRRDKAFDAADWRYSAIAAGSMALLFGEKGSDDERLMENIEGDHWWPGI